MSIQGIGHVAFNCKNLENSVAFYRDILGCTVKFTISHEKMAQHAIEERKQKGIPVPEYMNFLLGLGSKPWCIYLQWAEMSFIELFCNVGATEQHIPGNRDLNYTHFSLAVDDIHGLREDIIRRGGESYLDTEISRGVDGSLEMWLHDVDGNKIEFMEYTADSLQCQAAQQAE